MTSDQAELRRLYTSASLGHTAYRTWAAQARHERRFNIARLFEALAAAKLARAESVFQQLGEAGSTSGNIDRALAGLSSPRPSPPGQSPARTRWPATCCCARSWL
ncbi:MAG: hypothetical protein U0Z44_00245 [Kouleothrix sp.]